MLEHNIFFMKTSEAQLIRTKVTPVFTTSKLKSIIPLLLQRSEIFKDWLDTLLLQNEQINCNEMAAEYTVCLSATGLFGHDMQIYEDGENKLLQFYKNRLNSNVWKNLIKDLLPDIILNNKLYDLFGYYMFNNATNMRFFDKLVKDIDSYRKEHGHIDRHDLFNAIMGLKGNEKLVEKLGKSSLQFLKFSYLAEITES